MTRGTRDFMEHLITVYRYSRKPGVLMRSSTLYTLLLLLLLLLLHAPPLSRSLDSCKGREGRGLTRRPLRREGRAVRDSWDGSPFRPFASVVRRGGGGGGGGQ